MGMVVKAKVCKLVDDVMEVFYRCLRKEFTCVVQGASRKRRILVRFQELCEKDITLNQLTIVKLENIPVHDSYDT